MASRESQMLRDFRIAGCKALVDKVKWADTAEDWQSTVANLRRIADVIERACIAFEQAEKPVEAATEAAAEGGGA